MVSHGKNRYMTQSEIEAAQRSNPIAGACAQAVSSGAATYKELADELRSIMVSVCSSVFTVLLMC